MQHYAPITPLDLSKAKLVWLDFSQENADLIGIDPDNTKAFTKYVFDKINQEGGDLGIGGWLENRTIYRTREQFNTRKIRNIHLGVDIWMAAETPLYAPEDCNLYGLANNEGFGNYGPTLVLKAKGKAVFYLYGHLSVGSLDNKTEGQDVEAGKPFAKIGSYPTNGDWPPHLHFQVISNMLGQKGDFPGVCAENELAFFKKYCLNPYPFLGVDA